MTKSELIAQMADAAGTTKAQAGNPKTGASIAIPASKTVTFRPAASLKRLANGG